MYSGSPKPFQIPALLSRYPRRCVWATYVLINGFITIALLAVLAMVTGTPMVFPSLGPTAYLLFSTPVDRTASPRNTLLGHAVGILCGYAALLLTGLADSPTAMIEGVTLARTICAALALATTGALMILLNVSHAPAGATTLIVALGIITKPHDLVIIELAVVLLVLQAMVIHRLAGVKYAWWATVPIGSKRPDERS
jgi:CBS domain-containing membrane protein